MSRDRTAPRGHGLYLFLISVLPEELEPRLRRAAAEVRSRRRPIRLFRQRWVRRSKRGIRRTERRLRRFGLHTRRLSRIAHRVSRRSLRSVRTTTRRAMAPAGRTLRSRVTRRSTTWNRRRIAGTDAALGIDEVRVAASAAVSQQSAPDSHPPEGRDPVEHSGIVLRRRGWITRRLFPAIVEIPGAGPIVLVDALGHTSSDVLACLAELPDRSIIATSDPNVGPLRSAGVIYEYIPADTPGDDSSEELLAERIASIGYAYGVEEIRPLPLPPAD